MVAHYQKVKKNNPKKSKKTVEEGVIGSQIKDDTVE